MDGEERDRLQGLIDLTLNTIVKEAGIEGGREWLPLEIEQVVTKAIFEAHRIGGKRRKQSGVIKIERPLDDDER